MIRRFRLCMCVALVLVPAVCGAQSWTTPWTATTGVLVTAAQLNQTRDNLTVLRAGGFAVSSQAIGDLLCASSTTQFSRLAAAAVGQVLASSGAGVCPAFTASPSMSDTTLTHATTPITLSGASNPRIFASVSDLRLESNNSVRIQLDDNSNGIEDFRVQSGSGVDLMYVVETGLVAIGDTSNGSMAQGLTINQTGADDEILAFKSSDVAHLMTSITEADTYGFLKKHHATNGGLFLTGMRADNGSAAVYIRGNITGAGDTTKSNAGTAAIMIEGAERSGTSNAVLTANANILGISDGGTTVAIIDKEGDVWTQPGTFATLGSFTTNTSGVITSSSVGTGALRTATSSAASGIAANVAMQDYTFFPNIEQDDCTINVDGSMFYHTGNQTNDTTGRFRLTLVCSAGSWDVRYRYVTASDNPDIWVLVNDATGAVAAVWQAEDPIDSPLSAAGHTAVRLDVPTAADVKAMYTDLEPTLRQQARADFLAYLVQRGWASDGMTVAEAIDQIPARYRRAARLWAVRCIAKAAGVDPAELMLETMHTVNGAIAPKPSYALVVEAYRTARATRVAAMRSQAIERMAEWVPTVPASLLAGGSR